MAPDEDSPLTPEQHDAIRECFMAMSLVEYATYIGIKLTSVQEILLKGWEDRQKAPLCHLPPNLN